MKNLFLIMVLAFVTSCATGYHSDSFSGGFSEQQLAKDIFRVNFKGNGYTSSETVERYLFKRGAELTIKNGYTHFLILTDNASTKSSLHSNYQGNYGNGYSSGYSNTYAISKHSGTMTIKMVNNPPRDTIAMDAAMIFSPTK